jgi:hypothetical protein
LRLRHADAVPAEAPNRTSRKVSLRSARIPLQQAVSNGTLSQGVGTREIAEESLFTAVFMAQSVTQTRDQF